MTKKTKAQLILIEKDGNRLLALELEDNREMIISIFNGGGYYTDFQIETGEEVDARYAAAKKVDEEYFEKLKKRVAEEKSKPWYQFWK